jgi:hypothetical protein
VVAAGVYAGAGASAGAINAGISGSNVGIGAAFGAGFAVASYACPYPSFSPFGQGEFGSVANRMFNSSLTGAAFGAVSAGMTGGDILKGMGMGAASWGIAEAGTMAMANAAGYILSGGQAPKFQNGTFIYDLGPNSGGLITFSNVILGNASMINEKMISYTSAGYSEEDAPTYLQHENGHSLQGTILGPDYIPLQAASLTVGALVGTFYGYPIDYGSHAFGLLEHYWQTVPEPPR